MVFKALSGLFAGGGSDEDTMVFERALKVHGLREYNETAEELDRLNQIYADAPTKSQKQDIEKHMDRVQCRQDALRSAAVVLVNKLGNNVDIDVEQMFGITKKDIAKVSSGFGDSRKTPANEVVKFLVEEAQSDFISGRA